MRAVGIILAGGNSRKMKELTSRRAAAAMPVAGSYRAIDFTLSNMTNSHIQKVAVLTQYNARSLNEHLNSSKWWDFGRKQGGLYVFTPTITDDNGYWYRGTADAIYQNLDFLRRCHEPYVIITSGDAVYKMDYNKVLEYHIAKKADFTVVTANVEEKFDHIAEGKLEWTNAIDNFYKLFHPVVEEAKSLRMEHKVGERILGTDPKSGRPVSVKIGRFGPLVQIGTPEDEEKPLFASLLKGQSMSSITLDEALRLFDLPRTLGDFEDKPVTVGIGKFGPYIRHDNKYVSLPKTYEPLSVTLEEAIDIIRQKREQESQRLIKSFTEEPDLEILNGRYGAYIAYKKKNYKIPKGSEPASLSLEACLQIIKESEEKPATKKRTTSKKSAK